MSGWMPSARYAPAPAARRRLLRSVAVAAAVLSGVAAPAALPGAAAAGEGRGSPPAVGELVRAGAEAAPAEAAAGHGPEGPVSWVQPAQGDPVHVDTAGL